MIDGGGDATPSAAATDGGGEEDEAALFEAAFGAELQDFHMALADDGDDACSRLLQHVVTLRAMSEAPARPSTSAARGASETSSSNDAAGTVAVAATTASASSAHLEALAEVRREMVGACVQKARAWVEQRAQQLVAEFHLRWHEDADLLAVDRALRRSFQIVRDAEAALEALPVCVEILGACEKQLQAKLSTHVRKANRHELRVLLADFCRWEGRDELERLCLDKYREQVDKHVQSEAVQTQMKLLAILAPREASAAVASASPGGAPSGGEAAGAEARSTVQVLSDYLEGVAGLGEELKSTDIGDDGEEVALPAAFVASVLREVEQEACTQTLELSSHVLKIEGHLYDATASAQPIVDGWADRDRDERRADAAVLEATISNLDVRLEEVSGMLQLLQSFEHWCDDLPQLEPAVSTPVVAAGPPPAAAAPPPSTAAPSQAPSTTSTPAESAQSQMALPAVTTAAPENGVTACAAADDAAAAVSACSVALSRQENGGGASADHPPPPANPVEGASAASCAPCAAPPQEPRPTPAPLSPPAAAAAAPSSVPPMRKRSEARLKLDAYSQGLACGYLQGEVAYLECAVRMAADLTEVDAESSTLSLVDDAFFVLLKAFTRSVHTGAATLAVIPLLNALVDALRTLCLPNLQRYLRHSGGADATNERFLVAANSMQCAAEYTRRLSTVVSNGFAEHFPELSGMAEVAVAELAAIAEGCTDEAGTAMRRLAVELLPAAWLQIDFATTSFELLTDQAEMDAQVSFESGLLAPLRRTLEPLLDRLRAHNADVLVHAIGAALAERMEESVMHKSFNESGAMLLSEMTRRLIDALSEFVSGSVRNEFGRLNQVAFLLNAGSVQEAAALLISTDGAGTAAGTGGGGSNTGSFKSRLQRAEAARVLKLRSDFPREELSTLFEELDIVSGDTDEHAPRI